MTKITNSELSKYKKTINTLLKCLQKQATRCLYKDDLIQGTPGALYKKCGKKTCRCNDNKKFRHGPYKNIQIRIDKKKKLVSLNKDNQRLWDLANNYQYQTKNLKEFKKTCEQLETVIIEVLEKRSIEFP